METKTSEKAIKIYIGTPCYGGQCFNGYVSSLLHTVQYFRAQNSAINLEISFLTNESLITRGRNTIVAKFLADKQSTHLLFIDADISWHPSAIEKLIKADVGIVGAIYPKKTYNWKKLSKIIPEITGKEFDEKTISYIKANLMDYAINYSNNNAINNDLLDVKHIATVFMLIQREVLEGMCEEFKNLKFEDDTGLLTPEQNKHLYSLFDCQVSVEADGKPHYLSEDYLFCKRWLSMGGKIYAEVTSVITHTGTHAFQGNYLASLRFGEKQTNILNNPLLIQNTPLNLEIPNEELILKPNVPNLFRTSFLYFHFAIIILHLALLLEFL